MLKESIYSGLQHRVRLSGYKLSVSEIHGSMAAVLCANDSVSFTHWERQFYYAIGAAKKDGNLDGVLSALYDKTRVDLISEDFSFQPVMPDDGASLVDRTSALAQWCEGFLYGLGYILTEDVWSGDCGEILQDLVEISKVDSNVEGEADEASLFELIEYVRIAVQLLRAELQSGGVPVSIH